MLGRRPALGLLAAAAVAAVATGALLSAPPAQADWLVPHGDGKPIETEGPWEERDGLVVFRTSEGTLASMRVSDVDLAASRELTERGPALQSVPRSAPQPAAPGPPRKAVLVLTDNDVGHVDPAPQPALALESAADDASEPAGAARAEPAEKERLAVASWTWERTTSPDGIELSGQLANHGDLLAANVALRVVLFDREGHLLRRTTARLDRNVLDEGEQTGFVAGFPGLFDFANARFEATGYDLVRRPEPPDEPPDTPPAADSSGG